MHIVSVYDIHDRFFRPTKNQGSPCPLGHSPGTRSPRDGGIDRSLLSRYLRGLRKPPEGFEARLNATLDRLEAAERAANEARERVLAGGA